LNRNVEQFLEELSLEQWQRYQSKIESSIMIQKCDRKRPHREFTKKEDTNIYMSLVEAWEIEFMKLITQMA